MEMLALATAAPVGSVMVPTMVASCASADLANRSMKARARNGSRERKRLRTKHQLPAFVGEREFIGKPPGLRVEARPTGTAHFVNVYGLNLTVDGCQEKSILYTILPGFL